MDALELIKTDHDRLKQLFDQALETNDPGDRASRLQTIRAELVAHERMEEDVFYPALRAATGEVTGALVLGVGAATLLSIVVIFGALAIARQRVGEIEAT